MTLEIILATMIALCLWAMNIKPERKQPIRRANGQIARKIKVNYYGKTIGYITL